MKQQIKWGNQICKRWNRNYHRRDNRNAIDQASGVVPWFGSQEGVEIEKHYRPLKEKLEPNEANKEGRGFGH